MFWEPFKSSENCLKLPRTVEKFRELFETSENCLKLPRTVSDFRELSKNLLKLFDTSENYVRFWEHFTRNRGREQWSFRAIVQNICSEKFLKNSIKLLTRLFPVMLGTFFTRRALKGKLGSQRALRVHLSTKDTRAIKHTRHSGTQSTWALGTWGTRVLKGHLGIWALKAFGDSGTLAHGHLRIRGTRGTLFSRPNTRAMSLASFWGLYR